MDQFADPKGLGRTALTAAVLGVLLGVHLALAVASLATGWPILLQWAVYACGVLAFHLSEFLTTAKWQPDLVNWDSFLVNHSTAYHIAAIGCWLEFWFEGWLVPSWKGSYLALTAGLLLVLAGGALRAVAMWTAGRSFTHIIASERRAGHVLVTHGVYAYLRHPAYVGWALWAVGTQVLLGNPLCFLSYAAASWHFFADRIPYEEHTLIAFFGARYARYARSTWLGLPGIHSPAAACSDEQAEASAKAVSDAAQLPAE